MTRLASRARRSPCLLVFVLTLEPRPPTDAARLRQETARLVSGEWRGWPLLVLFTCLTRTARPAYMHCSLS